MVDILEVNFFVSDFGFYFMCDTHDKETIENAFSCEIGYISREY